MNNNTHHTPETTCPCCGKPLDAASNIDGSGAPDPGDVTLCAKCGELLAFKEDLTLMPAPPESLDQLDPDQVILMHKMRTIIKQKAAHPSKEKPSMTNTIKLDDELTIAWIREFEADRQRRKAEVEAFKAEVEAKIEAMGEEAKEHHAAFWKRMGEVAPATIDGNWRLDLQYLEQGLVFLNKKEEKADDRESIPAPIRALMEALEAGTGGKVGVAKITLKDKDKDEDE